MGVNGGWSGITKSHWQSEDCGRVLKWTFTHLHLLLPGLNCHSFLCPRFFPCMILPKRSSRASAEWHKSLKSEERVWVCPNVPKGWAVFWKRRCRIISKTKIWKRCLLCLFGVQAVLVVFILPFHDGTGSLKCSNYSWKCWAWTWETCGTMEVLQSRSCECWHQVSCQSFSWIM